MLIFAFCIAVALFIAAVFLGPRMRNIRRDRVNARKRCSVCGAPSVVWEGQYCSHECEARLAKSMEDWHDRFEDAE